MHTSWHLWISIFILSYVLIAHAGPTKTPTGPKTHVPLTNPTRIHKPTIFPINTSTHTFSTQLDPFKTETRVPRPTRTRGPDSSNHPQSHQSPIVIFFEALSGVVALVLFLVLLRFCHSYRKTPVQDRVSGIISRHRLQLEMEELQRRPPVRRFSIQEPAPPYLPRPPSYGEASPATRARPTDYDEIPARSPPDSPASSHVSLEAVHPLVPAPNHALPNG